MSGELLTGAERAGTARPRTWLSGLARRGVLRTLARLREGEVRLVEDGETRVFGGDGADPDMRVRVEILDPSCFSDIALGGTIGVAEAYMAGKFRCDDLTALVRIFVRNESVMDDMESGGARLMRPLLKFGHFLNRNTRTGSRRNIAAHYDLGNEFFELFLDRRMMYSSAVYPRAEACLEEAAEHKLALICDKLALGPDDHLLEIGTGWGGLAVFAAQRTGCRVTTTTISREQYAAACARVAAAGLEDRVEVLLSDYRDLSGQYDKLVSVEMFEAVGHRFFDTFFDQCTQLLKPAGEMLLQTITIADQRYQDAKRQVDFIQRYIFPGGCLPSVTAIAESVTRASDMRIVALDDIGPHYARTLRDWRERFYRRLDEVRAQGFPEPFIRMWEWYLCYCEGGFSERTISNAQITLVRPENRRALPVGP